MANVYGHWSTTAHPLATRSPTRTPIRCHPLYSDRFNEREAPARSAGGTRPRSRHVPPLLQVLMTCTSTRRGGVGRDTRLCHRSRFGRSGLSGTLLKLDAAASPGSPRCPEEVTVGRRWTTADGRSRVLLPRLHPPRPGHHEGVPQRAKTWAQLNQRYRERRGRVVAGSSNLTGHLADCS
jgi:hypothetical protein